MGRDCGAAAAGRCVESGTMKVDIRAAALLSALLLAVLPPAVQAADPVPVPAVGANDRSEPAVQRIVTEDDNVRIEELRVRGETQNITVHSKMRGAKPYQIVPATGARDPSQAGNTTGQRVWNVLAF